jgi:hypothetical protein
MSAPCWSCPPTSVAPSPLTQDVSDHTTQIPPGLHTSLPRGARLTNILNTSQQQVSLLRPILRVSCLPRPPSRGGARLTNIPNTSHQQVSLLRPILRVSCLPGPPIASTSCVLTYGECFAVRATTGLCASDQRRAASWGYPPSPTLPQVLGPCNCTCVDATPGKCLSLPIVLVVHRTNRSRHLCWELFARE